MAEYQCPFSVGDTVIWAHRSGKDDFPEESGLSHIGIRMKITEIFDGPFGKYLKWEGMKDHPGGGLHWTESSSAV
jgi:hypothetical protein